MDPMNEDLFFDREEMLKAMSAPDYAISPRYRENVAAKLQRSMEAGRISQMGEEIVRPQVRQERIVSRPEDGQNGFTVAGAHPAWAEASKANDGSFFKSQEEIANAFSAPAFEIDRSYQEAVREKIARSIREGYLTSDLKPANPFQRGR